MKLKFINVKYLLIFYIPLVAFTYLGINHYYNVINDNQLEVIKTSAANDLNAKSILINEKFKSLTSDIDIINWEYNKDFNTSKNTGQKELEEFLRIFIDLQKNFRQVRFMNTSGYEIIRVDFDVNNRSTKVIQTDKLQDKSGRYYFIESKKLENNEIYFSNIDLHMDFGIIEYPYKPVVRVVKKTYNQEKEWTGIVVVTYLMKDLFSKIKEQGNTEFTTFELTNEKGNHLISDSETKNFNHLINKTDSLSLANTNKQLWDKIQNKPIGNYTDKNNLYVFKKLIIDGKSTDYDNYNSSKTLYLINKIDLEKINQSNFVYLIYKWGVFFLLSVIILICILAIQSFNQKLINQNKKLHGSNNKLNILKNKIQETLNTKLDELKLTERKFYSIFNNAAIGIALTDLNGVPVFSNKKFNNTIGYTKEEIVKMKFKDFTHPDDVDSNIDLFKQLLSQEIKSFSIEKRYIRKDGVIIWVNIFVSLLKDENNNIINTIAVVNEITNLKDAQKETKNLKRIIKSLSYIAKVLNIKSVDNVSEINESVNLVEYIEEQSEDILNANKEREELLKNLEYKNEELNNYAHIVSHDLKTPLRSIYTLFNWIEEDSDNTLTEEGKMYTQLILDNLEKMESLIGGILNYSKLDQSKMQEYNINTLDLVNDIIKLMAIPKSIEIKIDQNLPIIVSNKFRMNQVFQNLLENAIKSIVDKTGIIEIGVEERDNFWEFFIKDNGKGIDKKYFKKIFELFQSIDDNDKNLGMGLSIVKKVIQFYNGNIWLESIVDKGTTFYFTLPKNLEEHNL
ncbi:PAS domain S-box protein [Polaribacter sp. Asnod1-A03]|uniref:sensor histidine kinase n=1 Tax=Polaribacter sp. Asnod1-A03 TaxID=3160581 RepID=UPI00386BC30F